MKASELNNLPDGTPVDTVTVTVKSVNDPRVPKQAGWATEWFAQASDESGRTGLIFALKNNEYDPKSFVGKTITITSVGGNGIKTKKSGEYTNLKITNTAKIVVLSGSSAAPTQHASVPAHTTPRQSGNGITQEQKDKIAKHLATEWNHIFDLTHEIFATRVGEEKTKECVTSVFIQMKREYGDILPMEDLFDWRSYKVQNVALGTLPEDKIKNGYVLCLQGVFKNPDTARAFTAAVKELKLDDHRAIYGHFIAKEGIEEDTAHTILLKRMKAYEDMSDADFAAILADKSFFDEGKELQASKKSAFDEDDQIPL